MAKPTTEEYLTITRINHESGNERDMIELKGRFLIELSNNAFSGTNVEDAVEHVEKFLKIADSVNVPNVSHDRLRVSIFLVSLIGAASEWFKDESIGSITKWVDLANNFVWKFSPPSRAGRIVETNEKKGDDQEVMTNEELFDFEDGNLNKEEVITQIFRIDTNIFHLKTPLYSKLIENTKMMGFMNGTKNTMALEESNLKDEAFRNKAALEKSMNQKEESSNDDWSHYSPIEEWEDHEHDANIEADVNSNYNPYFDISRLLNDHMTKNDDKDVQDEMVLNKDKDDDVGI
nr:hypothetical protein [Tanacetum cinerariifolium]